MTKVITDAALDVLVEKLHDIDEWSAEECFVWGSLYVRSAHAITALRAQITELIAAASDIPVEYDYHGNPSTPEWVRFVAALNHALHAKEAE